MADFNRILVSVGIPDQYVCPLLANYESRKTPIIPSHVGEAETIRMPNQIRSHQDNQSLGRGSKEEFKHRDQRTTLEPCHAEMTLTLKLKEVEKHLKPLSEIGFHRAQKSSARI